MSCLHFYIFLLFHSFFLLSFKSDILSSISATISLFSFRFLVLISSFTKWAGDDDSKTSSNKLNFFCNQFNFLNKIIYTFWRIIISSIIWFFLMLRQKITISKCFNNFIPIIQHIICIHQYFIYFFFFFFVFWFIVIF